MGARQADISGQQIPWWSQEGVTEATGDTSGFAPGTAVWAASQLKGQQGNLSRIEELSRMMGAVKLNAPEFDVKQGDKYTSMFQSVGRREGDAAAQGVSSALASRGGGGIGSAAALGAQARSAPNIQALSAGVGYDFSQYQKDLQDYMTRFGVAKTEYAAELGGLQAERSGLQNAMATRFNIINQIIGANLGQVAGASQIQAAEARADAGVESAIWGAVGSVGAASLGG